jgi:hypothetical protein
VYVVSVAGALMRWLCAPPSDHAANWYDAAPWGDGAETDVDHAPDGHLWAVEQPTDKLARVSLGSPWTVDGSGTSATQSATVSSAFGQPLTALVADADGTPLAGVTVTFRAPGSGASATFANGTASTTAVTGADGIATLTALSANATAGSFDVTATADHANTTATFALTNVAAAVPTTTTTAEATTATLPVTGTTDRSRCDTDTLAFIGAGSLLLGAAFVFASRRSRSSADL